MRHIRATKIASLEDGHRSHFAARRLIWSAAEYERKKRKNTCMAMRTGKLCDRTLSTKGCDARLEKSGKKRIEEKEFATDLRARYHHKLVFNSPRKEGLTIIGRGARVGGLYSPLSSARPETLRAQKKNKKITKLLSPTWTPLS